MDLSDRAELENAEALGGVEGRLARAIPGDVRAQLSEEQVLRLVRALKPEPANHGLALKASFRWFGARYYLACFGGEERRSLSRLEEEGQLGAVPVGFTFFIVLGLVAVYGLFPIVIMIYLVKTALGIDFFDGPSGLHALLCG